MASFIIFNAYDLLLYGMGITLSFIAAISYFNLGKKKEASLEKSFNYAYSIALFCLSIEILFLILGFLFIKGTYHGHLFIINFQNITLTSQWLIKIAYFFFWIAFIPYYFTYEKMLERNKHIVAWLFLTIAILMILLPYDFALEVLHLITFSFISSYFNITLFKLMRLTQRNLRAATAFILIGTGLCIVTLVFTYPVVMEKGGSPSILVGPICWLIGSALCLLPSIINPNYFLRGKYFWYFICSFLPIQFLILTTYLFINGVYDIGLLTFANCLFNSYLGIRFLRFLRTEDIILENHQVGITGIFTKPEDFNEDKISMYREGKICLVCKKKIKKFNYICPNCEVFYCKKCYDTSVKSENICWVCQTPLDESKPVKLEEVLVEKEIS